MGYVPTFHPVTHKMIIEGNLFGGINFHTFFKKNPFHHAKIMLDVFMA